MTQKIKFKIVTPERVVFEQEIDQITLPVTDGQVTILPGHRSYIASLKTGKVIFKSDGKESILIVSHGFIEFDDNKLVVLADTADSPEDFDANRAEEIRKHTEELQNEMAIIEKIYAHHKKDKI